MMLTAANIEPNRTNMDSMDAISVPATGSKARIWLTMNLTSKTPPAPATNVQICRATGFKEAFPRFRSLLSGR